MQNNPMQMIMNMMQMGNNPQQILQNIMMQNPQASAIMNQMNSSGMSPKQFCMQYAKQNNLNIDPLINMFNQMGAKF